MSAGLHATLTRGRQGCQNSDCMITFLHTLRTRIPLREWLIGLAFVSGLIPVVMAATVHNRCSNADPACVYHSYTLVENQGLWVLAVIGAPSLLSLAVGAALHRKVNRRSLRADHAALGLAVFSCLISFVGLLISGFVMLIPAALTVCAVVITPLPPDPSDPLARPGAGYFRPRQVDRR
jgi:hypothetical protein